MARVGGRAIICALALIGCRRAPDSLRSWVGCYELRIDGHTGAVRLAFGSTSTRHGSGKPAFEMRRDRDPAPSSSTSYWRPLHAGGVEGEWVLTDFGFRFTLKRTNGLAVHGTVTPEGSVQDTRTSAVTGVRVVCRDDE